ncbi:MAG: rubredoxin-like domain-containing protein [Candidatus Thorarchaeota archaeon]
MNVFRVEQYVCRVCGYNIIGYFPQNCPFCGTTRENFITAEFCSENYKIVKEKITNRVSSLFSSPALGLEHRAYCINTNQRIWIDCPSTFQMDIERMDKIIFTHNHFLGASNLYRNYYTAFIWIHQSDIGNILAKNYSFDKKFSDDFELEGIKAFHLDGHTPGFTCYIFENILFVCDYVFLDKERMRLNPHGSSIKTIEGAFKLREVIRNQKLEKVCGYNYTIGYLNWKEKFKDLLTRISV